MNLETLIKKYRTWEITNQNSLTLKECYFILEREDEFMFVEDDCYNEVMDYRDHLESEME